MDGGRLTIYQDHFTMIVSTKKTLVIVFMFTLVQIYSLRCLGA